MANPVLAFLAAFLRAPRRVREDRGDPREDDAGRRADDAEEELEEIEAEEEEEG